VLDIRGNLICSPTYFDRFHNLFNKLWIYLSSRCSLNAILVSCLTQLELKLRLASLEALTHVPKMMKYFLEVGPCLVPAWFWINFHKKRTWTCSHVKFDGYINVSVHSQLWCVKWEIKQLWGRILLGYAIICLSNFDPPKNVGIWFCKSNIRLRISNLIPDKHEWYCSCTCNN
jgi:hypothetical protein